MTDAQQIEPISDVTSESVRPGHGRRLASLVDARDGLHRHPHLFETGCRGLKARRFQGAAVGGRYVACPVSWYATRRWGREAFREAGPRTGRAAHAAPVQLSVQRVAARDRPRREAVQLASEPPMARGSFGRQDSKNVASACRRSSIHAPTTGRTPGHSPWCGTSSRSNLTTGSTALDRGGGELDNAHSSHTWEPQYGFSGSAYTRIHTATHGAPAAPGLPVPGRHRARLAARLARLHGHGKIGDG